MSNFEDIKDFLEEECRKLCNKLDIDAIELDIFEADPDNYSGTTLKGTPLNGRSAGYYPNKTPPYIALPIDGNDSLPFSGFLFPPSNWDPSNESVWPEWRRNLWHEVCHWVSDKELKVFNAQEMPTPEQMAAGRCSGIGHGPNWEKAINYMADKLKVPIYDMAKVLDGKAKSNPYSTVKY